MAIKAYSLGELGTARTEFLADVIGDIQALMHRAEKVWPKDKDVYELEGAIRVASATIGYLVGISQAFKAATMSDGVDLVTVDLQLEGKLKEWGAYVQRIYDRFQKKYTRNRGKENLSTARPPLSLTELRDLGAAKVKLPDFRKDVMLTLKNGMDLLVVIKKKLDSFTYQVSAGLNWVIHFGGDTIKFAGQAIDFAAAAIKKAADVAGDVLDTGGDALAAAADLLISLPTIALIGGGAFLWFKWDERKKRKTRESRWGLYGLGQARGGNPRTWAAAMTAAGYGGAKLFRYATGNPLDEGALAILAKLTVAGWATGFAAGAILNPPGGKELPAVAGALGGFYDAIIGPRVSPITGTAVSAGLGFFLAQPTAKFLLKD